MRTVTITVGTGAQGVTIGRRAENEATAVIFDVSALIETYGDGGAVLMVKRPTDADAYPATVERSGASVTWTPTETDLAYKGMGEAELFWYVDGMLAKTAVYTINIRRDIGETTGEAPAPYDDWIATLTELGGQTAENAQRAEVARAAAETAAATATSAANTANTAAERAESAANNAEQDAASTAADRTAAEDAAARAATSATAAAQSASAAETSAGQAGLSANSAASSATSAEQSASAAQSAVASIGDSVTRAESAATTAQGAANTATTKAAEATTSAGTAAINATTALNAASQAAQSATQAAQSATAAQTAQTGAEAAQTGAETAQTAAESAAANAEAEADRAEGYADRLIDVYPTDTASGSIASFPDGADDVEVKSATVQIVPKQAGTGDPSPDNVRPISGWDAVTVTGTGKNLLDDSIKNLSGQNIVFGGPTSHLSGTSCFLKAGTYTFSVVTADGAVSNLYIKDSDADAFIIGFPAYSVLSKTFTLSKDTNIRAWCYKNSYTSVGDISHAQIETGSATAYEPYTATTYPLTLPATVYGGTLTYDGDGVWTGESDMALVDLGTLTWSVPISANPNCFTARDLVAAIKSRDNALCDTYMALHGPTSSNTINSAADKTLMINKGTGATTGNYPIGTIIVKDSDKATMTASEFKTAMSGVHLVYELATPITYTLTTEQVVTLLGQNNFFADCGDASVEYRADIQLYIDKLTGSTEDDMTADANIPTNTYFLVGNTLYKSTAAIAAGATISPGTNCTKTDLAAALNALQ